MKMNLSELVQRALDEDMPQGDLTTDALDLGERRGHAQLIAKQNLVLSGSKPFSLAFELVSKESEVRWKKKDGESAKPSDVLCEIEGPLAALLKSERTALNFLGRLSGIATLTRKFVSQRANNRTQIVDTRKTTPLLRELEKKAVMDGGGVNHRFGLSDGVLIKENHIRAVGSITGAVQKMRAKNKGLPVEVEITNLTELKEALECKVERVLLDNMLTPQMEEAMQAVRAAPFKCLVEASGNMSLERIAEVSRLSVDFISVGALTHSAPAADVSLLFL